jgi:dihydrofolate reductase
MRRIIAALHVTLDGCIEGPQGEVDWIDIHAVGGAALVSSLLDAHLIDELQLVIHPIVLGRGKRLFKDVAQRHALEFMQSRSLPGGTVELSYRVQVTP